MKGFFTTDKNNNLIYILDKPAKWKKEHDLPDKIKLTGTWKLDKNHNLVLKTTKTKNYPKSSLTLYGKIEKVNSDYLSFRLQKSSISYLSQKHLITLRGRWQADKFNRLTFEVKKKDKPDTLRFKNIWEINKNNKIIYIYKRKVLKTKKKQEQSIQFSGFWQLANKNKICYKLTHSKKSQFDFRAHLQTTNVYPKKGAIKYRIGVGYGKTRKEKTLKLYGSWKFSRKLGLFFEVGYGRGKLKRYSFSAKVNLTNKDKITFSLLDNKDRPLGLKLRYQRKLFNKKDLEFFTKLSKKGKNYKATAGLKLYF
ncbi:MAG: hypothetical protein K9L69_04005 [Candidatus Omnitrophica bacterium]|nr:hypothetical protein [Candidatus Omnitrophota bacterium]MCF7895274.1 hypothetical protein [Candidatus Omnitrophota bacterium]